MSRLPPLAPEDMTPVQRRIHDEIASGPRGTVPPPQQIWLHAPKLADPAQQVGAVCRYGTTLPTALSEIAILTVGREWRADYEFWAHARIAKDAGVSDDFIEALRNGEVSDFSGAPEHAEIVHKAAREMLHTGRLSDATYAAAHDALGSQGLVELVGIVGYYCLISLTLNVFDVKTPDGSKPVSGT